MKWGGAVVSVILLVVWVGSGWCLAGYAKKQWSLGLRSGQIWIISSGPPGSNIRDGWAYDGWDHRARWAWGVMYNNGRFGWEFDLPLWLPTSAALITTALAWRLDTLARRRARVGFCPKCSYNRTGLPPQAVCPECGTAAIVPPPAVS